MHLFHFWVGQLLVLSIARPSLSLKLLLIAAVMHAKHSVHRSSHLYNDIAKRPTLQHIFLSKNHFSFCFYDFFCLIYFFFMFFLFSHFVVVVQTRTKIRSGQHGGANVFSRNGLFRPKRNVGDDECDVHYRRSGHGCRIQRSSQ